MLLEKAIDKGDKTTWMNRHEFPIPLRFLKEVAAGWVIWVIFVELL